jgi:hypothetical protein
MCGEGGLGVQYSEGKASWLMLSWNGSERGKGRESKNGGEERSVCWVRVDDARRSSKRCNKQGSKNDAQTSRRCGDAVGRRGAARRTLQRLVLDLAAGRRNSVP